MMIWSTLSTVQAADVANFMAQCLVMYRSRMLCSTESHVLASSDEMSKPAFFCPSLCAAWSFEISCKKQELSSRTKQGEMQWCSVSHLVGLDTSVVSKSFRQRVEGECSCAGQIAG